MSRKPVVSGRFYPGSRKDLESGLSSLLRQREEKVDTLGAVVPHAGYMYSGRVAGEVYSRIIPVETYVVLGTSHTGIGSRFAVSDEDWVTPLGEMPVDQSFVNRLLEISALFKADRSGHSGEHSIEVQVPFLQFISPGSRLVPVTVRSGDYNELREAADTIASVMSDAKEKVTVIASSDMTHYETRERASEMDHKAIDRMLDIDPEGLLKVVNDESISMCGVLPVALMLAIALRLGVSGTELVDYRDSGDVTGDTLEVVGYAGVLIRR